MLQISTDLTENDRLEFLENLKEEAKIFTNFNLIFNKIENDDYLDEFYDSFATILKKEMTFTVIQLQEMKKEDDNLDIKHFLKKNIYIFKENLKLIVNTSIEQLYKQFTDNNKIDNFIKKEKKLLNCDIIHEEVEEENIPTEIESVKESYYINESNYVN